MCCSSSTHVRLHTGQPSQPDREEHFCRTGRVNTGRQIVTGRVLLILSFLKKDEWMTLHVTKHTNKELVQVFRQKCSSPVTSSHNVTEQKHTWSRLHLQQQHLQTNAGKKINTLLHSCIKLHLHSFKLQHFWYCVHWKTWSFVPPSEKHALLLSGFNPKTNGHMTRGAASRRPQVHFHVYNHVHM